MLFRIHKQIIECMFIRQAIDLLEGLIPGGDDAKEINTDHLKKLIMFSMMWSLGALLELEDRKKVVSLQPITINVAYINVQKIVSILQHVVYAPIIICNL